MQRGDFAPTMVMRKERGMRDRAAAISLTHQHEDKATHRGSWEAVMREATPAHKRSVQRHGRAADKVVFILAAWAMGGWLLFSAVSP